MPTRAAIVRSVVLLVRHVLLPAALALLVTAVAAVPAVGVEAQGIGLDPFEPSVLGPDSVLRPAIPAGGAATYDLVLRNQRDAPVEVLVYGADVTGDSQVSSGADNRGVGSWITAADPRVALQPGATTTIAVTVTRPAPDTAGGTGAIVTQLSEQSRQDLGLAVIRRAALRVAVAADGSGDGVHVEVAGTDPSGGLLPGVLAVDVRFADPGRQLTDDGVAGPEPPPATGVDGRVVLSRPFVEDPTYDVDVDEAPDSGDGTTTVEVPLPWYGVIGDIRAEAAVPGLTTSSAPVRVVLVPPWLVLLLLVLAGAAAVAVLRERRGGTGSLLGRVPDREGMDRRADVDGPDGVADREGDDGPMAGQDGTAADGIAADDPDAD